MSSDGRTCTLNDPKIVGALQWMVNFYDMLGGRAKVVSGFEAGFQGLGADPFLIGKVAMKIDGNWNLDNIARYKPDLDLVLLLLGSRGSSYNFLGGRIFSGDSPWM